ncbi:hypothetical protein [Pedobacter heparinus]|uniref:hypothetical protein n=1 Tax=Pedobacter heparinus TaxID=984 RepID=UPI002931F4F7|nr:hypothetical protein [Pedobacter heparinus]
MKTLKILAVICITGVLLQIYLYINLKVSNKYEVDLMETHVIVSKTSATEKAEKLHQIALKKQEIAYDQKVIKVLFWMFLIGLIILLYLISDKCKLRNKVITI